MCGVRSATWGVLALLLVAASAQAAITADDVDASLGAIVRELSRGSTSPERSGGVRPEGAEGSHSGRRGAIGAVASWCAPCWR